MMGDAEEFEPLEIDVMSAEFGNWIYGISFPGEAYMAGAGVPVPDSTYGSAVTPNTLQHTATGLNPDRKLYEF